jgi:DNA modification methylase
MFEPIRKWFENECKKSGLSVEQISKIDSTRCSHYWAKVQFEFPTKEVYCKIQTYCVNNSINAFGKGYEEIKKEYEEIKKEYEEIKKEFYKNRAYFDNTHDNMNNVWHFDRAGKDEREHTGGHATPKPIALCSRAIKSSSREGEIVLDVFGGSGSTLIACEQLNRKCYMAELDPKYVSVILQRYINFKGSNEDVFLLKDGKKIPYSEVK